MDQLLLVVGLVALALGLTLYWKSRAPLSAEAASRIVKARAREQPVRVTITPEQMEAIRSQWIRDPARPAEITFLVDGEPVGELKVATCPYWGDTCCA